MPRSPLPWATTALLLATATQRTVAAAAGGCTFCATGAGSAGGTATFDLGGLGDATHALLGAFPNGTTRTSETYLVTSPCGLASSAACGPTDAPMTQGCKPLGRLAGPSSGPNATTVTRTPAGFNLTLRGGFDVPSMPHGRNAVFNFVCDQGAAPGGGPEPGVVESPSGFYRVTWRTPAACRPASGHGACPPPPPAPPAPPPPAACTPGSDVCREDRADTFFACPGPLSFRSSLAVERGAAPVRVHPHTHPLSLTHTHTTMLPPPFSHSCSRTPSGASSCLAVPAWRPSWNMSSSTVLCKDLDACPGPSNPPSLPDTVYYVWDAGMRWT